MRDKDGLMRLAANVYVTYGRITSYLFARASSADINNFARKASMYPWVDFVYILADPYNPDGPVGMWVDGNYKSMAHQKMGTMES